MTLRHSLAALALLVLAGPVAAQSLFISEVDVRTNNSNDGQFVEIYNAGPGSVDLSDYVVVLYDGEVVGDNNVVYAAYNLTGTLAADDYYVLCGDGTAVDNCDRDIDDIPFIRQGPAAVALYEGDTAYFPAGQSPGEESAAVTDFVDAVVYGPFADLDQDLIDAINDSAPGTPVDEQYDEDENGNDRTESLQRAPDADSDGFAAIAPTPGDAPGTVPNPTLPAIDIEDARDEPLGTTVSVEGIVTRTEGDLLFLEDATAAILIDLEANSGVAATLRDDVEDGDIEPGTILNVTGQLSDDTGSPVLRIAADDLDAYTIVGTDEVPEPQTVTLAQISANGEEYESELVRVRNLSFADDGTFTASRNYAVSDGSITQSVVTFFLPDAGNTRVEGTAIPDDPTDVIGIVNQGGFSDNSGYRLLGIDPADIGGNATEPPVVGDPTVDLVISEIDPSQAGSDEGEFVELYNAESTAVDLEGYALVFFSGLTDRSYQVVDLDGESVAAGEFFVVCGNDVAVANCDLEVDGFEGLINGPAAVALYAGSDVDFPDGTETSTTDLVDALVYSTSQAANDTGLLNGLDVDEQVNEDLNGMANEESIQRLPVASSTFVVQAPTPGELPVEGPMVVTLAEARELGVDETVTVTGTVTRARGAFVYLQDATGGLAIRQTSGDFFDDVADGTIAPGTAVEITGTLSEFNGLLQINGSDLEAYETIGSGDTPNPVLVTLRQLVQNGEDYEGELVAVSGVTFEAMAGEPFEAGTTYQISDASSSTNEVTVRVPSANDTDVDGELIPSGPVTVVGVVGQFDSDGDGNLEEGYQLLVIDDTDVNPDAVARTVDPSGELALAVANPIRGAATVSFETAVAGPARLALYDALGRRVAVLADGQVAAGVHETSLDAASLAPGVYVLRLQAEDGAVARTVTVVR